MSDANDMAENQCRGNSSLIPLSEIHKLGEVSQVIAITQEPQEELTLRVSASERECYSEHFAHYFNDDEGMISVGHECCMEDTFRIYDYVVNVTFHNNVHEISKDYEYEITLQVFVKQSDGNVHYQTQLLHRGMRISKEISLEKEICHSAGMASSFSDVHIRCDVRRLQKKRVEAEIEDEDGTDVGKFLFKSGTYSDATMKVGATTFQVHKSILSLRSKVFEAMFSHDTTENRDNIVIIEDFDAEVVEELLSFVYTGETKRLPELSIELFKAADKYALHSLRSKCEEYFLFDLRFENVVAILEIASLYELKDLREGAMKFIHNHEQRMVKEGTFLRYLCSSLDMDTIVSTLKISATYSLESVKLAAFQFVKEHNELLIENEGFMGLFTTHPLLMRELYYHNHKLE